MGERLLKTAGLEIERDPHGVPRVLAAEETLLYRGLGFCHARDRGLQMLLMRVLGQGRLSEQLDGSSNSLKVDAFFRRMNWTCGAGEEERRLGAPARKLVAAYCEGVNEAFSMSVPWELRLAGYRHTTWRPEDSVLLMRMTGYLTLAQSQGDIERLLVEMVQAGVDRGRLEELFPGRLGGLDEELVRSTTLGERIVPADLRWGAGARFMASNNWVVSGSRTASGKPLLANDPHLEGNRLPAVWYEVILSAGDRHGAGATMPGLPGLAIGRTRDLAWGATYTFADAIDSWVEECRDGCHLRDGHFVPFRQRREVLRRKKGPDHEMDVFENDHGVLSGDPRIPGRYLATRWASSGSGARSIEAFLGMWNARTVEEGMERLGAVEISFNWVLADQAGNIGYQMSGLVPRRREGVSGLAPLPGWDSANDWRGFQDPVDLPRLVNPACGFIVTANDDLNRHGRAEPISVSMGSYRAERITDLLKDRTGLTAQDMAAIQQDLHSLQAERFMKAIEPLLPQTTRASTLRQWDFRYDVASRGAVVFEDVYRALRRAVFGREIVDQLIDGTGLFADFYAAFDRVLLSGESAWFGEAGRDERFRRVLADTLSGGEDRAWGDSQKVVLSHMLLGGKLPRFLGFDRGPITLPGGRATPQQGQIYRSGGRTTSFVPSYRMVTDLGRSEIQSALLGGPSDRRGSPWYCSELAGWVRGEYKTLSF